MRGVVVVIAVGCEVKVVGGMVCEVGGGEIWCGGGIGGEVAVCPDTSASPNPNVKR